jgi:hypothetical protein
MNDVCCHIHTIVNIVRQKKKNTRLVTFNLLCIIFIFLMPILFSFIPVNVILLLFPSRTHTHTQPPPSPQTTTDDEKTNRTVCCSLISFSLFFSFLPELSYVSLFFSFLSCVFFAPFVLSLSLSFICVRIVWVEDKE